MKKKTWNIFSLIILILLVAAEALFCHQVLQLDMLPAKYNTAFIVILGVIALLLGLMMLRRKKNLHKVTGRIRQIIGYLLSLVMIAGSLLGFYALSKVNNVIDSVTETPEISAIVDVYVMKEDPAQTIQDAKDYTFAVTESYDWENTQLAIAAVEEELGSKLNIVSYGTVFEMIDALYHGDAGALFLNSAYLDILEELELYADYSEKTRIIYEYNVLKPVEPETEPTLPPETTQPNAPTPGVQATEPTEPEGMAPFIVYLSGSDTRSKVLRTSRSDVNILAVVNPQTHQILLLNTPRDYYIANPSMGNKLDKLTHCGVYGIDCSITALENLYGIDIASYAQINFTGFETLIDAIGGVTVYSDYSFTTLHGKHSIVKGYNDLNGSEALGFARERYALPGGDRDRGKNQMKIITAVIEKLASGTILTRYAEILDSMKNMFVTSMSQESISELVKMQIEDMSGWNIQSYAVTGKGGSDITCSMPGMKVYVMYPSESSVAKASELINRVLQGDILTAEDLK